MKTEETKSISQFFSRKEARAPQGPKLETTIKEEPVEANEPTSVKEEGEAQSTHEKSGMKDELIENSKQIDVKVEQGSQDEYHKSVTEKHNTDNEYEVCSLSPKETANKTEKRGYENSSTLGKPLAKETEKKHISPVAKRSKGVDDKQPTLFSYFGRR